MSTAITRYFEPAEYKEQGFQTPITMGITEEYVIVNDDGSVITSMMTQSISKSEVDVFHNSFLDTSSISLIDFSEKYTNYAIETETKRIVPSEDNLIFSLSYQQSRVMNKYEWSRESLDIVLGLVGGFAGICWSTLSYLLASYQGFKYETSLISHIFPTSPGGGDYGDADIVPSDEKEAKEKMLDTVAGRGKYFYSFLEYSWSLVLRCLCHCCCKNKDSFKRRMKRLERH